MVRPITLHEGITIIYPTTVYQKTDVPPGYVAVPVASEDEVRTLMGSGAVFLTSENAIRYQPPPEQPMPHIRRTDNFEQYIPGKSVLGVEIAVPLEIEHPVPGEYERGSVPPPPLPPGPPPETQASKPAPAPTPYTP